MALRGADRKKPPRPWWFWVGTGCGSALVLLLIVALILYKMATYVPPEARQALETSPASQPPPSSPAPGSPSAPGTLETQLARIEDQARRGQPGPVTVTTTEAEFNSFLARQAAEESGGDVHNPRVTFGAGTMTFSAVVHLQNRWLYVQAEGVPEVRPDGGLRFALRSARLGSLGMPAGLRARLQEQVDQALRDATPQKTGLHLTSITVAPGELRLTGNIVPRR